MCSSETGQYTKQLGCPACDIITAQDLLGQPRLHQTCCQVLFTVIVGLAIVDVAEVQPVKVVLGVVVGVVQPAQVLHLVPSGVTGAGPPAGGGAQPEGEDGLLQRRNPAPDEVGILYLGSNGMK